jgi:hypothetical protein
LAKVHDGFGGQIEESELPDDYVHGGFIAYGLVPPERILVPCLGPKGACGHNHPEPVEYTGPSLAEIAEDAIQSLADLIEEVDAQYPAATYGIELTKPHHEQLAYLKQALKEWQEAGDDE